MKLLNIIAPFDIAEDWDNSGLQAGNLNWEVKKVMIGLDVTTALMNAANENNCDLVITHHPLMIHPEKSIDFSRMPGEAIKISARSKISIISAHTNLDKANNGLNDYFAEKLGLLKTMVFFPESPASLDENIGLGRIGQFKSKISLKETACLVKENLNLTNVRVTGNMGLPIKTIAICTGSGGSLVSEFIRSNADLYITGDIKYHEARLVEEYSKGLIDVGHFGSEHMVIDLLSEKLSQAIQKAGLNIEVIKFKKEKDPFTIV